jgi:hypothetical protein
MHLYQYLLFVSISMHTRICKGEKLFIKGGKFLFNFEKKFLFFIVIRIKRRISLLKL